MKRRSALRDSNSMGRFSMRPIYESGVVGCKISGTPALRPVPLELRSRWDAIGQPGVSFFGVFCERFCEYPTQRRIIMRLLFLFVEQTEAHVWRWYAVVSAAAVRMVRLFCEHFCEGFRTPFTCTVIGDPGAKDGMEADGTDHSKEIRALLPSTPVRQMGATNGDGARGDGVRPRGRRRISKPPARTGPALVAGLANPEASGRAAEAAGHRLLSPVEETTWFKARSCPTGI